MCVYEENAHRLAPTTHRNREHPGIFLALASTTVFSVMDGPKNVMQVRLRPAQDEKPILCHLFFIEVGAHHIYDDTCFCHNYRHRSVITMTEKIHSGQNFTNVSFFGSDGMKNINMVRKNK